MVTVSEADFPTGPDRPTNSPHAINEPGIAAARTLSPDTDVRPVAGLAVLYAALLIQSVSALFFLTDLWTEVLGLRSFALPWAVQELIQILASFGLTIGVVVTVLFVRRSRKAMDQMRRQIDVAAGNFEGHLATVFEGWGLSNSERDVAIYAMKGFSNLEIAELRGTSASTIKSQMNAIYKKAGLANRQQLISYLVEDLLSGVANGKKAA